MGDDEDSQPTRVCPNCSASLAGASQYCSERRAELDEMSYYQPMIEESVPGFVDAIGFSGHGFMQAPHRSVGRRNRRWRDFLTRGYLVAHGRAL